jgi:hypothetical protein
MQQRYYDPDAMRFLSMDPVEADSAGGNLGRYWYANDNPYRYTDPDGRQDCVSADCKDTEVKPTTGCLTSGCNGSANVSVTVIDDSYRRGGSSIDLNATALGSSAISSQGAGNSAGNSSGSASGQSADGSIQAGTVTKQWTIQDFNDLDRRATNSYAPLFLAPVGLGAGGATVWVGGPIAWDAAAPYVRPVFFAGCMGFGLCNPETAQHLNDYAEVRKGLATMMINAQSQISQWWQQVVKP